MEGDDDDTAPMTHGKGQEPTINKATKARRHSQKAISILSDLVEKVKAAGLEDIYANLPPPKDMTFLGVSYRNEKKYRPYMADCIPECLQIGIYKLPGQGVSHPVYVHWPKEFYTLRSGVPMFWPVGASAVERLGTLGAISNNRLLEYVELFYPFHRLSRGRHEGVTTRWYALLAWYFLAAGFDDAAMDWDTSPNCEHYFLEALKEIRNPEVYAMHEDTQVTIAWLGGLDFK